MPRIDNEKFYNAAIERHGLGPQGVHWNSEHSQKTRFKVITSLLPQELSRATIVDAGCGFGDFYRYLADMERLPAQYTGLDCMEPMVAEAKERTGCEIRLCDILHDPLVEADYYICSGAMNILERFETHLFIRRCYEHAKLGFVFNMLEGRDESMVYNYFTPGEIKKLGRELGARVVIKKGYLERDMTVAFYKGDVEC
jgi:2-polyprenyl-3-methyl-5-hydroxy-6-metoxy-1,4-benzoquinol methylase